MAANVLDFASAMPQARQVRDAAAAISSLCDVYDRTPVAFIKTLDNLLIGLGEPAGLRVCEADSDRTFEAALTHSGETGAALDPFQSKLRLQVSVAGRVDGTAGVIQRGSDFIEAVGLNLRDVHSGNLERLARTLEDGFRKVCEGQSEPSAEPAIINGVTPDEAAKQLAPVFDRLERFLLAQNHRFHLPHNAGQCRFVFFHRYIGLSGRPETRLHLLASQREAIRNAAGERGVEQFETLSAKVFSSDNWLLDERLGAGVSGWTDWPWQRSNGDEFERVRNIVSTALFSAGSDDEATSLRSALVIPIHVDGLPWLGLAGMFGTLDEEAGLWSQRFYRDLLPYLTTTIRAEAERAYLRAVRDTARMSAHRGYADAALITSELALLAAIFPYQRITASVAANDSPEPIDWVGGTRLALNFGDLGIDAGRFDYGRLNRSGLLAAFEDGRNAAEAQRTQRLEAQLLTYMDVGHTLKNVVECTGWAVSAEAVGRVANYFEETVSAGLKQADIEEFGVALGFADRSLSLFWIMSSLGHFIRLSGAHSGSYGWDKFSDWIDLDRGDIGAHAFAANYLDAVRQISTTLAYGSGWSNVLVTNGDGSDESCWTGEPPPPLDVKKLHLPPFKKGADAGYVFAFCLLEPLLNAIRALGALPPDLLAGPDSPSLEIKVLPVEAEDRVDITIFNLSSKKLPLTLSGLRSAKAMVAELGLATFEGPNEELLQSGLYGIRTGVSFHPRRIFEAITQAGQKP